MKHFIVVLIAGGLAIPSIHGAEGVIQGRQARQQRRIAEGVRGGSLTPRETVKLERKERAIRREVRRDRRDGKGLTGREKAKITRQQNRVSREIYNEKHDAQRQR